MLQAIAGYCDTHENNANVAVLHGYFLHARTDAIK